MKILRFIGLGVAAVGVTGGLWFASKVWRNSRRCPECGGKLEIESFEVLDADDSQLSSHAVAVCEECGRTFDSENGAPWTPRAEK